MAPRYDILQKPPPDEDKKGWYRWFYRVTELLNNPATVGAVTTDSTLTGTGTAIDPLGVGTHTQPETTINFSDITTGDTSVAKHGYAPKLSGVVGEYLDGTGSFSTPPVTGSPFGNLDGGAADSVYTITAADGGGA